MNNQQEGPEEGQKRRSFAENNEPLRQTVLPMRQPDSQNQELKMGVEWQHVIKAHGNREP